MTLTIDAHRHLAWKADGQRFFPVRLLRHLAMDRFADAAGLAGGPPRTVDQLTSDFETAAADNDGDATLASLDAAGIDGAVLIAIDYEFASGASGLIPVEARHEHLAQVQAAAPGRFRCLAGIDPRRPGSSEIFDRAIRERRLSGLVLYPRGGFPVWDERAFPLYERCLDAEVPVVIVTSAGSAVGHRDRFAQPVQLADVVAEYPDLQLVVFDAGAPLYHWFEETLNSCARNTNAAISLGVWIRGFRPRPAFAPSIDSDEESVIRILARLRDVMGAHRIMWGSDTLGADRTADGLLWDRGVTPVPRTAAWLKTLPDVSRRYGIRFTQQEADWIAGDNAARTFGFTEASEWKRTESYRWRRRLPSPFKGLAG